MCSIASVDYPSFCIHFLDPWNGRMSWFLVYGDVYYGVLGTFIRIHLH